MERAVWRLDRWLDTMRGPDGYGGPVAHWWRDNLVYCGAGLDWRYEGIIAGYLTLFQRTSQSRWLEKARRAADDLLRNQSASGSFRNSRFEQNPGSGGTPHEAAADVGLLLLAQALRSVGQESWEPYLQAAQRNLLGFYLGRLWRPQERRFWDDPQTPSFVPNKAATLVEALCLLADLTGREDLLEGYVRPTADAILAHQRRAGGSPLDGAIAQNTLGRVRLEKYFPFYCARCAPGLLAAYHRLRDQRYLEGALAAMAFVLRWRDGDGAFPQVVYPGPKVNRYPRWIAATGDILRAAELLHPWGLSFPPEPTRRWLLAGQLASGGFATAHGFGSLVSQEAPPTMPEFRDLLPACGWADKAFRYLAGLVTALPDDDDSPPLSVALACAHRGRQGEYREDSQELALTSQGRLAYRWRKGTPWAQVVEPWVASV
ncbi:MAG: hypothetical protein HYY02_12685 [Chloroflexi bacterium]|nr:hypothetical protein [Chloroflexota bacterium]